MMAFLVLLAALVAACMVAASPIVQVRDSPISLPIAVSIGLTGSANFVASERARAQQIISLGREKASLRVGKLGKRRVVSVGATNAVVTYTTAVGVGSPATNYNLLIDTGSSNTWIGANQTYRRTSTSRSTNGNVTVSYGSGTFSGQEYLDQVTIASGLAIRNQSIGVASKADGFNDVDGILGIGPVDLTKGTVSNVETVPTVVDNLFEQGSISSNQLGISFAPAKASGEKNGELTFGGIDTSKFTGKITYTSTTHSPANEYWGIDQSISYGASRSAILNSTAGIVDTGTTLVLLATNAFQAYKKAVNASLDEETGLLKISNQSLKKLESMYFSIGGTTFELTANAQLFPRSLNSKIGGQQGANYLIVADLGTYPGSGLDFINGFSFLERFYSVYDTTNRRVGLATTANTHGNYN